MNAEVCSDRNIGFKRKTVYY